MKRYLIINILILIFFLIYLAINLANICDLMEILLYSTILLNLLIFSYCLIIASNAITALVLLLSICFLTICIFISQEIEFLALLVLIIYIGSLAILFLFIIMLFEQKSIQEMLQHNNYQKVIWWILNIIIFSKIICWNIELLFSELNNKKKTESLIITNSNFDIQLISKFLYEYEYILFIILSFILLISLIGSVILAKNSDETNRKWLYAFFIYIPTPTEWLKASIKFLGSWPLFQWVSSLIGLVITYYSLSVLYNKIAIYLQHKFGWKIYIFSNRIRLILFNLDLFFNYLIGTYCMLPPFSETIIADFLHRCPIALSPFILIFELLLVILFSLCKKFKSKNK